MLLLNIVSLLDINFSLLYYVQTSTSVHVCLLKIHRYHIHLFFLPQLSTTSVNAIMHGASMIGSLNNLTDHDIVKF